MLRKKPPTPDATIIEQGVKHCSMIEFTLDYSGAIYDESGAVCWQFETSPKRSPRSLLNLKRKPDFVFLSPDGKEQLRICRSQRFHQRFQVLEESEVVGEIHSASFLRNAYTLEFASGLQWTFRMPLFTIAFWGDSNADSHVWVLVGPQKTRWNFLSAPGVMNVQLLASLVFIHREWWCF